MTKIVLAYITMPTMKRARVLSRKLLEARLVACTNLIPQMESHYNWNGKKEIGREIILIAKTLPHLSRKLETYVKNNHPYECPCIVFIKGEATKAYGSWVNASVSGKRYQVRRS